MRPSEHPEFIWRFFICQRCPPSPRALQITTQPTHNKRSATHTSHILYTSFPPFSVYITWLYLVVMYIVPFTCLAAFNLRIYLQIRKANEERAQLSRLQQREIRMATMLMIVVMVFFVCNVLALTINILEVCLNAWDCR